MHDTQNQSATAQVEGPIKLLYKTPPAAGDSQSASSPETRMKLSLVSIEKDGCIRLAAEGEITSHDFYDASGKNPLETVMGENWASNNVMLSLEKITFLDSSAIGWLIDSQRKCKSAGGKLVLHSAPVRVRDVFDLLKMRVVLNLKEDEAAAREFFAASAATKTTGNSAEAK